MCAEPVCVCLCLCVCACWGECGSSSGVLVSSPFLEQSVTPEQELNEPEEEDPREGNLSCPCAMHPA